ncbi:hypothetical protein LZ31DRAFT_548643 [Colletotrichum somersetense]|nr:hypothetical protein LZ31DRAFT_548643 [Colletotrichum somersetense]
MSPWGKTHGPPSAPTSTPHKHLLTYILSLSIFFYLSEPGKQKKTGKYFLLVRPIGPIIILSRKMGGQDRSRRQ